MPRYSCELWCGSTLQIEVKEIIRSFSLFLIFLHQRVCTSFWGRRKSHHDWYACWILSLWFSSLWFMDSQAEESLRIPFWELIGMKRLVRSECWAKDLLFQITFLSSRSSFKTKVMSNILFWIRIMWEKIDLSQLLTKVCFDFSDILVLTLSFIPLSLDVCGQDGVDGKIPLSSLLTAFTIFVSRWNQKYASKHITCTNLLSFGQIIKSDQSKSFPAEDTLHYLQCLRPFFDYSHVILFLLVALSHTNSGEFYFPRSKWSMIKEFKFKELNFISIFLALGYTDHKIGKYTRSVK